MKHYFTSTLHYGLTALLVCAAAAGLLGVYKGFTQHTEKPSYNLAGGNPEILANPFETTHAWLNIRRADGKDFDQTITPDQLVIEVDFEPIVTKFANGTYRITLRTQQERK